MSEKDYLQDISEIKNIMNRSSRFISLSGLSGILAGTYALVGAFIARNLLINYDDLNPYTQIFSDIPIKLLFIAIIVIVLSITTGIILSQRKAKSNGDAIWSSISKRLLINFMIPLVTGGIFCIILIQNNFVGLIAPCTLIFYGLACVNASKYTLGDIRYLGIIFNKKKFII